MVKTAQYKRVAPAKRRIIMNRKIRRLYEDLDDFYKALALGGLTTLFVVFAYFAVIQPTITIAGCTLILKGNSYIGKKLIEIGIVDTILTYFVFSVLGVTRLFLAKRTLHCILTALIFGGIFMGLYLTSVFALSVAPQCGIVFGIITLALPYLTTSRLFATTNSTSSDGVKEIKLVDLDDYLDDIFDFDDLEENSDEGHIDYDENLDE